ncbi:MAG: FKBP-type peptidyl-prolyl cis-trans isomerase [Bacteroidales bacterium]
MKKKILSVLLLGIMFNVNAQNKIEEFTISNEGVLYKIEKINQDGQRIKEGDLIIGRFSVYYDDSLIYDGMNQNPRPVFPVVNQNHIFEGDLIDGLRMMHLGDITTFAFPTDTMKKYNTGVPETVEAKYVYYKVAVDSLTSLEQMQKEEQQKVMIALQKENKSIEDYIKNNGWDNKIVEGIYVKHLNKGIGTKAKDGDKVKIHYIGQLLDGTCFDTSVESVARENNLYNVQRKYEPLEFVIGKGQMIKGFEIAAKQLNKGGKAIVLLPSSLAYGNRDMGVIKPYSPLLFTIEMIEISK